MNRDTPVVLITGAATGVGAAIAERMAGDGWNVLVNYRSSARDAQGIVDSLLTLGVDALAVKGDVSVDADCVALALAAEHRWGRIDALVNNAGITTFCAPDDLDGLQAEDFQRVMGVNVAGTYQMTRACVPSLRLSGRAAVLNISSQAGFSGMGSSIAYAASKAAINNMTLALARSLAPEIRVNALCPGFVNTGWVSNTMDETNYAAFQAQVAAMTPLGRMTEATELADVAHFMLATSAPITGELLGVDGGNHLTVNAPARED